MLIIIKQLASLGQRQGRQVLAAEKIIRAYLAKNKIPYNLEKFTAYTPQGQGRLIADQKNISCLACSFIGGVITNKSQILTSTIPSRFNLTNANINFNPYCPVISRPNFYFAPALAVAKNDMTAVINAQKIYGAIRVNKISTQVNHILVGNNTNPQTIIFAHYDSIGAGALDNASGVALTLDTIKNYPEILVHTLFIFDPNEELAYDQPTYWGHGFRVFEARHLALLRQAQKIIVVDCVGNGPTIVDQNPTMLNLAFPLANIKKMAHKTFTLYGDVPKLMAIYHSNLDTPEKLSSIHLKQAQKKLLQLII